MQTDTLESAQQALRESAEALKQAIDSYVETVTITTAERTSERQD